MTTATMAQARAVLQRHWQYDHFKAAQEEVLGEILQGNDCLAVLATGYGKSVCFQVPGALFEGLTIVVSPLIALMKDQVDQANARGLRATYINSHVDAEDQIERMRRMSDNEYQLVYVAPERIRTALFRDTLKRTRVSLLAIDEAHCASMWGHDFRPAYSRLHEFVELIEHDGQRCPILAVTATATADIEKDVATSIGLREGYKVVIGDPIRENLRYVIESAAYGSAWTHVLNHARRQLARGGRHIIYCGTRKACVQMQEFLKREDVGVYHAGLDKHEREEVQDKFVSGKLRAVCATNAFGMGIDIPDVRSVIHFGIPGSLEAYVQEAGRAGRDGLPSDVILVPSEYSAQMQRRFIDDSNPPFESYVEVWQWLNEKLSDDDSVMHMSASEMASRIPGHEMTAMRVSSVLNMMEAYGLVERAYSDGGCPVVVDIPDLRESVEESRNARTTVKVLLKNYLLRHALLEATSKVNTVQIDVDAKEVAIELQCASSTVLKALRELDADFCGVDVGKAFVGKTTRIKRRGFLDKLLPVVKLEKKRRRDLRRLDWMLNYCETKTPQDYIRTYFTNR